MRLNNSRFVLVYMCTQAVWAFQWQLMTCKAMCLCLCVRMCNMIIVNMVGAIMYVCMIVCLRGRAVCMCLCVRACVCMCSVREGQCWHRGVRVSEVVCMQLWYAQGGRTVGLCTDTPSPCVFSLEAPCFTKLSQHLLFTLLWLSNAPLSQSLTEECTISQGHNDSSKHHSPSCGATKTKPEITQARAERRASYCSLMAEFKFLTVKRCLSHQCVPLRGGFKEGSDYFLSIS